MLDLFAANYEAPHELWVKIVKKRSDYHQLSEAVSSRMGQRWLSDSHMAVKERNTHPLCFNHSTTKVSEVSKDITPNQYI